MKKSSRVLRLGVSLCSDSPLDTRESSQLSNVIRRLSAIEENVELSSFFVFAGRGDIDLAMLQLVFQVLIHRESHRLSGSHSHDPRHDALVQRREPLVPEHVARQVVDPRHGRLAELAGRLLQPRLDRIDGRIAQGPHGAADQANAHGLVARQLGVMVLRLRGLQQALQLRVRGEVDRLVGTLPQRGQRDAAVQRAGSFLLDDRVQGVRRVAVLRNVEGIGHRMMLRLQADLDHLHGRDHGDGFGNASRKPSFLARQCRSRWIIRGCNEKSPKNVPRVEIASVSLSRKSCLYQS